MAQCKCRYDKKVLDNNTAFKVVINGKNTYWCSEQCYNKHLEEKSKQDKIKAEYDEIFEITKQIFGYEFLGYSILKREVCTWEKVGTRQKIIAYLKENKDWLSDVMRKEFDGDFHRVRYYSAIVSSKLHDFKPKIIETVPPKVVVEEHYETKYKPKARKALLDFEEDC